MNDFIWLLDKKNINYTTVYDRDHNIIRLEFNYCIEDNVHDNIYRPISVKQAQHDMYEVYYRGYKMSKDPIKDYEVFRLLDAVSITDYGDIRKKGSKEVIKQIEIKPKNMVSNSYFQYSIDGVMF